MKLETQTPVESRYYLSSLEPIVTDLQENGGHRPEGFTHHIVIEDRWTDGRPAMIPGERFGVHPRFGEAGGAFWKNREPLFYCGNLYEIAYKIECAFGTGNCMYTWAP